MAELEDAGLVYPGVAENSPCRFKSCRSLFETMNTKRDALARARAVLRRMKTKGWQIEVWENLGWHWCLEAMDGFLTLSEHRARFRCLASMSHRHAGDCSWHVTQYFKDPNKAVDEQLRMIDAYVRKASNFSSTLKRTLGIQP